MPRILLTSHALNRWSERLFGEEPASDAIRSLSPPTRKERIAVVYWLSRGKANHDAGTFDEGIMNNYHSVFVNRSADAAFLCDCKNKQLFVVITVTRLSDCLRSLKHRDAHVTDEGI